MRLKDFSVLNPQYKGESLDCEVSFVPMESLRNGAIDYQDIPFAEGKGKYTYFQDGDLLVAKVTPCFENGNIAIANNMKQGVGFGSSEIFVLRMNDKVLNTYMFYITQTAKFQEGACATMCGVGGLKRISPLFMRTYELDIPSLSKQQRIVDYLDAKLGKIDARIAVLVKQQNAYARLKKSVIHQAVTRGLDPNVSLKDSGVEWIGMIPEHWETKRMKDIFSTYSTGLTPESKDETNFSEDERYTWVTIGDMDSKIVSISNMCLSGKFIKEKTPIISPKGSLLFSFKLSIGKTAFAGKDLYTNEAIVTIPPRKEIDLNYFYYLIPEVCIENATENIYGAKMLNQKIIANMLFAIPSFSEQQDIAAYLDEKCTKIDAATENIGKQIDALKRLKRALINEVITGQRAV